ncbi:ABC transporter substrate-binding protein [Chloroflexi bacterium TSY]|nr:ABC transporter substrate-binding protein [Chloroflexi bacterium TSY]
MSKSMTYLVRLCGLIVVLLLVVACGTPAPAGDTGAADAPASDAGGSTASAADLPDVPRERTLIIMAGEMNQYTLYDNQNPYIPGSNNGFHSGTLPAVYEPLIMFNVLTGEYENWLLEDWEYTSDTELKLTIRDGIIWNDGTPFSVEDIQFTFDMLLENAGGMVHLADLPEYYEESEIVDEKTILLKLNKPNPAFWATTLTTNHGIHVMPKHIWEGENPLEFSNHDIENGLPVGTGPYRMVHASPQQKIYDLRDDWWAAAAGFKSMPQVERIIYLPQQDESQAAQLLIQNQIDMSPIVQVSTLKTMLAQNPKIITYTGQEPPYGYLDWCPIDINVNASQAPFDDPDIRWALSYALDRESLVALAESGAGVEALHKFTPYGWFQPFEEALQDVFAKYDYDVNSRPEKVTEIMEGKGYSLNDDGLWANDDGTFAMNIFVPGWLKAWGPPLQQQLRDAGFDVTVDFSDGLGSLVQTGEQAVSLGCKGPSGVLGMDPNFMLAIYTSQYFRPTGEPAPIWWATSRWQNEEYDALVEQIAALAVDDPAIMPLFLEAMDIWVQEMPDIYFAQLMIRYPMSTEYWTGWPDQNDPYGFPHSWQWELLKTFINLEPTQ